MSVEELIHRWRHGDERGKKQKEREKKQTGRDKEEKGVQMWPNKRKEGRHESESMIW